ncbi:MAG: threonine synthase [Kiritimatiellia bacterium]|jgi:threonine synthase|nr:threonine synthase [Kiritimatiellia bacterium]
MRYISTRGGIEPIGFSDAVMMGLARDGGLLLPEHIPDVSDRLASWATLDYEELAYELMRLFVDLPDDDLKTLVRTSTSTFRAPEITPVTRVGDVHVLELWHGPTLAFKDVALQFLGNLFEYILEQRQQNLNILAATSGDTGSAAIYGVRGRDRIKIFVMHPKGRVSPIQEHQMTSVADDNVFNLAVEGTFDDCQELMKTLFADLEFKDRWNLGSVNSINWARLLAQVVYYFYAAFRVMETTGATRVRFAVPTGNFGDIFAGYIAARMGLPMGKLVLATNENDILARCFSDGDYSLGDVHPTLSPSMDIQVASNFERYLYYRLGESAETVRVLMNAFAATGRLTLPRRDDVPFDDLIVADMGDTKATLDTIRDIHKAHDYLLDPHSAVGVCVGRRFLDESEPMICLSTAHPAKFPAAIEQATGSDIARHEVVEALTDLPTRCEVIAADADTVREFLEARIGKRPGVAPESEEEEEGAAPTEHEQDESAPDTPDSEIAADDDH